MNIKSISISAIFVFSLIGLFGTPQAQAQDLGFNVCIAQFPCHLKTGKLLHGFNRGTPCKWENICERYRASPEFKKLQKKLQRQKRQIRQRS